MLQSYTDIPLLLLDGVHSRPYHTCVVISGLGQHARAPVHVTGGCILCGRWGLVAMSIHVCLCACIRE